MKQLSGPARTLSAVALLGLILVTTFIFFWGRESSSDSTASANQPEASTSADGRYRSRPGFDPPRMKMKVNRPGASKTKMFVGSKWNGATIFSSSGEPIWFRPCRCMDFRTQKYRGKPVLTWFEAPSKHNRMKSNAYMIANRNYKVIKRVYPGRGLKADSHEFRLTPRGTAFVTAYKSERRDLRPFGMGRNAAVSDSIAQEVDLRTGRVIWEWRSLDHVPIDHTYAEKLRRPGIPFDYFHINSIIDTPDGNIMISGRSTNAVYKVSRRTGRVIWTLGGKHSDFRMGNGAYFSSQHDAQPHPGNRVSIFDNGDSPVISKPVRDQSRGLVLKLNNRKKTARVDQQFFNPAGPLASTQANLQKLGNGNWFVGWGGVPLITEHASDGQLLLDAELQGISSFYRSYRNRWSGRARGKVALDASPQGQERTRFWASWNGDSRVRQWRVAAGPSAGNLTVIGTRKRNGFETVFTAPTGASHVKVAGLNGKGKPIGSSKVIRVR